MRVSRAALYAAFCALGAMACADGVAPSRGAIRVLASTSGVDLDPDGYFINLEGRSATQVESNGSVVISGLLAGSRSVRMNGLATNCALTSLATQSVTVVASDTVDVSYAAQCVANVGVIYVVLTTFGEHPDTNGYTLSLDGGPPMEVGSGGARLDSVPAGSHTLTLSGLDANCTTPVPSRLASVGFHTGTSVQFSVTCTERRGHLQLQTTTTGVDLDNLYVVEVGDFDPEVPANGVATMTLREGDHLVALNGVSPNCTVIGSNPRMVTIVFTETTQLSFEVACAAVAKVRVTLTTTGPDPDEAYRVRVEGAGFDRSADIAGDGTATIAGMGAGTHTVTLQDVAINCATEPASQNPRSVAVTSGTTTDVTFAVTCAAASQIAFIRFLHPNGSEVFTAKSNGTFATQLTTNLVEEQDPAYSPDGTRIAFRSTRDGNSEIYVMNADGSAPVRLTTHQAYDANPEWSPDGSKIAFRSSRDGNDEIYVMNADGTNVTRLTNQANFDGKPTWSPDGSRIAFMSHRSGASQIWVMNADGSNVVLLTTVAGTAGLPAWSPDGTKIAFVRVVECDDYYSSCHNIYVMNSDGSGEVRFATRSHDSEPAWSPDGKWIVFETRYCDYYTCFDVGISAVKPDGTGRVMLLAGDLSNPTWRPTP